MIVYVDTSAAMKLLVEEKESAELAEQLERYRAGDDTLVASLLLHAELHCAASRRPEYIAHESVNAGAMVVYDSELIGAVKTAGIDAVSPGAGDRG